MVARDALDAGTNPFEPAPDAIALDTTGIDADEVFRTAWELVRARVGEPGGRGPGSEPEASGAPGEKGR
jgi:cytidylate kinase